MRPLLLSPLIVGLLALGGWLICGLAGWHSHPAAMAAAAAIALLSTLAAGVPLWVMSGADQRDASQAGLVATMLHLFVGLSLATVVLLGLKSRIEPVPFIYWLLACYWATLALVVGVVIRAVRTAPAAPSAGVTASGNTSPNDRSPTVDRHGVTSTEQVTPQ